MLATYIELVCNNFVECTVDSDTVQNFSLSKTLKSICYNLYEITNPIFVAESSRLFKSFKIHVWCFLFITKLTKKSLTSSQNTTAAFYFFTQMILVHCIYVANVNREVEDKYCTVTKHSYVTRMFYLQGSRMASFKHWRNSNLHEDFCIDVACVAGVNGRGKRAVRQNVLPSIRALPPPPVLTLATQASHDC